MLSGGGIIPNSAWEPGYQKGSLHLVDQQPRARTCFPVIAAVIDTTEIVKIIAYPCNQNALFLQLIFYTLFSLYPLKIV